MDIPTAALTAAIGIASGVAGAAIFLWKVSGGWHTFKTSTEGKLVELEKKDNALKESIDNLAAETQEFADHQGVQWQQINRSLGQIEGALGNHPRRSRPG